MSSCATRARIAPRYSVCMRYRPGPATPAGPPVTGPAAVRPDAMSASLESAITKSPGV